MFQIPPIQSNYGGNYLNGLKAMVMQSQEDADKVLATLDEYLAAGMGVYLALERAYADIGVKEKDLSDFDKERIKRKVEETILYRSWK